MRRGGFVRVQKTRGRGEDAKDVQERGRQSSITTIHANVDATGLALANNLRVPRVAVPGCGPRRQVGLGVCVQMIADVLCRGVIWRVARDGRLRRTTLLVYPHILRDVLSACFKKGRSMHVHR